MKYEVEDRVIVVNTPLSLIRDNECIKVGYYGTVIGIHVKGFLLVEFDFDICGHSGKGLGQMGHCWWMHPDDVTHSTELHSEKEDKNKINETKTAV